MLADRILTTILTRVDSGARLIVLFGAATMVAVVSAQVVMRYVFNGSFDWADEVSRIAFVWTTFLGIREGSHVGITLFVDKLPAGLRSAIGRVMNRWRP